MAQITLCLATPELGMLMEFDIAAIIQGYAQGYFLMADEDGDNLVVFQP